MLGEIRAPDAEVVNLAAVVSTHMCDLVLTASHPDDTPGPKATGLTLHCLDAVSVMRIYRQVVPRGAEWHEHGVSSIRKSREYNGFCACTDITAVHT